MILWLRKRYWMWRKEYAVANYMRLAIRYQLPLEEIKATLDRIL